MKADGEPPAPFGPWAIIPPTSALARMGEAGYSPRLTAVASMATGEIHPSGHLQCHPGPQDRSVNAGAPSGCEGTSAPPRRQGLTHQVLWTQHRTVTQACPAPLPHSSSLLPSPTALRWGFSTDTADSRAGHRSLASTTPANGTRHCYDSKIAFSHCHAFCGAS